MKLAATEGELTNGLTWSAIRLPHLQSSTISIVLRAGSRFETKQTNGLSHLLEHMLFRGNAVHPTTQSLCLAVEALGGTLEAATAADHTQYWLTLPPENLTSAIAHFGSMFRGPLFGKLDVEKKVIREESLEDLDDDGKQIDVHNLSRELLYGDHPLAWTIVGPTENIERFQRADLVAHFNKHYGASNAHLTVAGPLDASRLEKSLQEHFSSMPPVTQPSFERWLPGASSRFRHVRHTESQSELSLSFHTNGVRSKHALPLEIIARLLDDGLSSRVHRVVCDEQGLAYDAYADIEMYEECGVFELGGAVQHHKTPELASTLLRLCADLAATRVLDVELDKAKTRYLWNLRRLFDDPEEMTAFLSANWLFDLEETPALLEQRIHAITAEDVRLAAAEVFQQENAHLVCVGAPAGDSIERLRRVVD